MIQKLRIQLSQAFAILLAVFVCISSSIWETREPLLTSFLFLGGAVLVGLASLGRLWCSVYIAGYKKDHLVTQGPYSMCRNPLYFYSFLGGLGVGLTTETLLIPLAIVVVFVVYYPSVIKSEEAELMRRHKDDFASYLEKTPKFFPKRSLLREPGEYTVKPVIFKRHMFNALWFIWFLGIIEIIEELHELSILPILFKVY